MRQFTRVMLRWRDAQGFVTFTRLYWAGPLYYETVGDIIGLLGHGSEASYHLSPLATVIDPAYFGGGSLGPIQDCSNARLETVEIDGGPENLYRDVFGGPTVLPSYPAAAGEYASVSDRLEIVWYTQADRDETDAPFTCPPPRWSFSIPAPVAACFPNGFDSGDGQGAVNYVPLRQFLDQFALNLSGQGERWDAAANALAGGWCSNRGVYLTNLVGTPYRLLPPRQEVGLRQRGASLTVPAV